MKMRTHNTSVNNHDWRDCVSDVNCFSEKEQQLLDRHFSFYWDIYNELKPYTTVPQKQFADNCYEGSPKTGHEIAFYKFLEQSGNVEDETPEADLPIQCDSFISRLQSIVRRKNLIPFYVNNKWDQYVDSRYHFSTEEAYILGNQMGSNV
jgi:hypothetical protein